MLSTKKILSKTLNTVSTLALLGAVFTSASWAMDEDPGDKRPPVAFKYFPQLPQEVAAIVISLAVPEKPAKDVIFTIHNKASCEYINNPNKYTPSFALVSKPWNEIFCQQYPIQQVGFKFLGSFIYPPAKGANLTFAEAQYQKSIENSPKNFRAMCVELAKKHSNVLSLLMFPYKSGIEQELDFVPAKGEVIRHLDGSVWDGNSFIHNMMLDTDLFYAMVQHSFPKLTALTVYHNELGVEKVLQNIQKHMPALAHLSVLTPENAAGTGYYRGTKFAFSQCWAEMSPSLKTLKWHYAPISDETATSISEFVKTTTTLTKLDLTGALISDESRAKIQAAALQNDKVTVKISRGLDILASGVAYLYDLLRESGNNASDAELIGYIVDSKASTKWSTLSPEEQAHFITKVTKLAQ